MTTPTLTETLLSSDLGVGMWTLDPTRTQVRIKHKTLWGLATVKGVFTDVTGSGEITPDHLVTAKITVGAASIDTKNSKRDQHLCSADFFEAETYPHFVLTVHAAATVAGGQYLELSGELTVKGVREPITLTAEVTALDDDILATHLTGTVDRQRFGVTGNMLGMIKSISSLDIDAVFTRAHI